MTAERFALPNGGTVTYVTRDLWGAGPFGGGEPIELDAVLGLVLHHTPLLPEAMGVALPADTTDIAEAIRFTKRLQTVRPDLNNEVPYSFVLMRGATELDAVVLEGRGPGRSGAHTALLNHERYGVAVAQNTDDEPMTSGQVEAFRWIGATFLTVEEPESTGGHSDYAHLHRYNATECPGDNGRATLEYLQPPFARASGWVAPKPTPAAPAGNPAEVGQPLARGDSGPQVTNWQVILLALGFELPEFGADGDFGEETEDATKEFERSIALDDDGIVSVEQARLAMNVWREINATKSPAITDKPADQSTGGGLPIMPLEPPAFDSLDMARGLIVGALEDYNQARERLVAALAHLDSQGGER